MLQQIKFHVKKAIINIDTRSFKGKNSFDSKTSFENASQK